MFWNKTPLQREPDPPHEVAGRPPAQHFSTYDGVCACGFVSTPDATMQHVHERHLAGEDCPQFGPPKVAV